MQDIHLRDENGVVIIEAAIALTAFMFFVVTLLSVVNICYVQARIGTALNETAKEMSEYSYLYAVTGLNEKEQKLYKDVEGTRADIGAAAAGIGNLYDAMAQGTDAASHVSLDNIDSTVSTINTQLNNGREAVAPIESLFQQISDDPKTFILSFGKLLGYEALQEGKSKLIAAPMTKCLIRKHLKNQSNPDCEQYLKALRIVPASGGYLNGIDFGDSTLFSNGNNSIKLVAKYKVKVVTLLPINIEMNFCQSAETEGWFGK